jgi:hypothetical protein
LDVGWVERSETHLRPQRRVSDEFRFAQPIRRKGG